MVRFLMLVALVGAGSSARADELVLQNDVYGDVPNAADCQPGFVRGEAFASIFVPDGDAGMYPMTLRRIMVQVVNPQELALEGTPGAASGDLRLWIWHDDGIDSEPGTELLHRDVTLQTGRREEIDLLADGLTIQSGVFRVGFEFLYEPTASKLLGNLMDPCPGIDGSRGGGFGAGDNTIRAHRNLIAAAGGGVGSFNWSWSEDLRVTQNWVLRAVVDVPGGADGDADADADGDSDADADADADGDADVDCSRATDCPAGNRCIDNRCVPTHCAQPSDCGNGYDCVGGNCLQFCSTTEECHGEQVCDEDGYCDDPPAPKDDKAGCACRMVGGRGELALTALAAAALALLLSRRRAR